MVPRTFPLEPETDELAEWTDACAAFVRRHLDTLPTRPAFDLAGADEVARSFREPPPEEGRPIAELLARLEPAFSKSLNTAGPGYLAFVPGGGLPTGALAAYVTDATNRYGSVAAAAPALAEMEHVVVGWIARAIGCGDGAGGILTTGGSVSTLSAIVTARSERLGEDFLRGTMYASSEAHACIGKAARIAGIPARNVRRLPVDRRFRLRVDALEAAVRDDRARGLQPFLVVANAGTTNTGAVDDIGAVCRLAAREGLWSHADACYGGAFRLVPGGASIVPDLERCDSVAIDGHKGFFLPYGAGCLVVREAAALWRAHAPVEPAAYLRDVAAPPDRPNPADGSIELSREWRALRWWLPIQLHGLGAFRAALAEKLDLAREASRALAAEPLFEVLDDPPQLTVVAFRLRDGEDAGNAALVRRVHARGRVFLSTTTIDGRLCLRLCVLSFRTHADRVRDAVDALVQEARAIAAGR